MSKCSKKLTRDSQNIKILWNLSKHSIFIKRHHPLPWKNEGFWWCQNVQKNSPGTHKISKSYEIYQNNQNSSKRITPPLKKWRFLVLASNRNIWNTTMKMFVFFETLHLDGTFENVTFWRISKKIPIFDTLKTLWHHQKHSFLQGRVGCLSTKFIFFIIFEFIGPKKAKN